MGYRILPVNPAFAGQTLFGETVVASLAELPAACDMIDVFRRPEALPAHLDEILALAPRPRTIWLQLGITHARFTAALVAAGFDVVEDRSRWPTTSCSGSVRSRERGRPQRAALPGRRTAEERGADA